MPIYTDDDFIYDLYRDSFSSEVLNAYCQIYQETENISITPFIIQNLIKKYLLPLVNGQPLYKLHLKKRPTWNDIYFYAQLLLIEGQKQTNFLLHEISFIIKIIYKQSAKTSRVFSSPESEEINFFKYLCTNEKIKLPNHHTIVDKKIINVLKFCIYCWRQPMFGKKICPHHSPVDINQQTDISRKQNFLYQEGRRQKIAFLAELEDFFLMLDWDISCDKNPSGFFKDIAKKPYLLPDENKICWLQQYRPYVFNFLERKKEKITEASLIKLLLKHLHNVEYHQVNQSTYLVYKKINRMIVNEPILIWPMLVRAEAWLMIRSKQRKKWGGRRLSGRSFNEYYIRAEGRTHCNDCDL